ncbi:MAG: Thiamine-monophosphate kinase [Firmicutes bacterium]|nr:Thiamine-monophosphate kinase [candidate division NPL-UPA2 bacterium]
MDTSDGLQASIEQLARSSNLTMAISLRDVPISELVRKVAAIRGFSSREDVLEYVFSDSVDFQLLFTVPESKANAFEAQACARGFDVWAIGRFEHAPKQEDSFAIGEDGIRRPLPGVGWDQSEIPTHLRVEQRIRNRRTSHGE